MLGRWPLISLLLALFAGRVDAAALSPKQMSALAPVLLQALESAPSDTVYDLLVAPVERSGSGRAPQPSFKSSSTLRQRRAETGAWLRDRAQTAQARIVESLNRTDGSVTLVEQFWITNAVRVRATRDGLLALAARGDVVMIAPNPRVEILQPVMEADASATAAGAAANLATIGARALWARGLTGRGRLVASIDTGVDGIHPALRDRWRGNRGDAKAAWFDPYDSASPVDNQGHGTHVMGVMVGRDGADTIGLAPDAEWITAAVIDRGGTLSATFADILAALQWITDPDGNPATTDDVPDVVCNSWGVSQQIINPCDDLFFDAIDHVEAMGIVCVFAAGNEGPYSMSIRNPADRAVTPTASFSVGAIDATGETYSIPSFSSRGPSACDGRSIKPEIVAPGVDIRSSYKGQSYRTMNGSSMAAPHVAAAVALLRQYNPDLTPEEIKTALLSTARDIGAPGEDNASGQGLLDLEAALAALPAPTRPTVSIASVTPDLGGDGILMADETGTLTVSVSASVVDARDLTAHLRSLSAVVAALDDESYLGTIPAGRSASNTESPFVVAASGDARAGDSAWFELSLSGDPALYDWRDTVAIVCGLPQGAALRTVGGNDASLTVSNFGQLGLGPGSLVETRSDGWAGSLFPGNVLYEAALVISDAHGNMSDASRRVAGTPFDFAPDASGTAVTPDGTVLSFNDTRSNAPVGVSITQRVSAFMHSEEYDYVVVSWTLRSRTGFPIAGLRVGWLLDIDLPAAGAAAERVGLDPSSGSVYHLAVTDGMVAGVAPLGFSPQSASVMRNPVGAKRLMTQSEKRALLGGGLTAPPDDAGDFFELLGTGPVDLRASDSLTVALALVMARDPKAFSAATADAQGHWSGPGGNSVTMPSTFVLEQNYPNPFNVQTIIPITVTQSTGISARVDIFDVLGRRVTTLIDGALAPGRHSLPWDGTDREGRPVASGVYFSRLVIDNRSSEVLRMVLLK